MRITQKDTNGSEIELIELAGELIGGGAIALQDYLYTRLDEGRCFQLMDLRHVQRIDGLGIKVISDFTNRGIQIVMCNVEVSIMMMYKMSGKADVVTVYNESNTDIVMNMFEKKILAAKDKSDQGVKRRAHARMSTDFGAEFKYNPVHNIVMSGKAKVMNLSEGGLMADNIVAINEKDGKIIKQPELEGLELYGMNFRFDDSSDLVEASGECVREFRSGKKPAAGIRFKEISKDNRDKIRDYICRNL